MQYRAHSPDALRPFRRRCWCVVLCVWALLSLNAPAIAHDLAIDQVMLWPERETGLVRGEITFDPELTRSKDVQPTDEHARQVVEFLKANLTLTIDGRVTPLAFEVRELWVRAGATLGDVVRFSAPLGARDHELRVHAKRFKALVVSVQRVGAPSSTTSGSVETTSWLLGKDDSTPAYHLDTGWQAPGWREGGPDVFVDNRSGAAAVAGDTSSGDDNVVTPSARTAAPIATGSPPTLDADDARSASWVGLAARFVRLGFEHILPGGVDHMLFVAGLVLAGTRRYRQILISLSLFTLAHTVTLALGNFQVLQVSPRVVEPLIAFSIFVLGVDNLRARRSTEAPAAARYAVVFGFGLVHGLGFASALADLSFDANHMLLGLFSFNLGVELGQVAVVALLMLFLRSIQHWQKLERYATLAGSAVIAVSGLVMVVQRVWQADDSATTTLQRRLCAPALTTAAASPADTTRRPLPHLAALDLTPKHLTPKHLTPPSSLSPSSFLSSSPSSTRSLHPPL